MIRLLAVLILSVAAAAQNGSVTFSSLGGGCSTAAMNSEGLDDQVYWQASALGTSYLLDTGGFATPSFGTVLIWGFQSPFTGLPTCGCVLHTDVTFWTPSALVVPAGYSFDLYVQRLSYRFDGAPVTGGCASGGAMQPALSNGYKVHVP